MMISDVRNFFPFSHLLILGIILFSPSISLAASPYLVSTNPPCRYADPRYTYPLEDKHLGQNSGLTKIELTFSEPTVGYGRGSLERENFTITYYRFGATDEELQSSPDLVLPNPPEVTVETIDGNHVNLLFNPRIPLGTTVAISIYAQSMETEQMRLNPGDPRNRLLLTVQPADLTGDGRHIPSQDISLFNQCYSNSTMPNRLLRCDMYKDNLINTNDVTRLSQLLNGVQSSLAWRTYNNSPMPKLVTASTAIFPIQPSSQQLPFIGLGNNVYFSAYTDDEGMELWTTSGTPESAVLLKDIQAGPASSWPGFASEGSNALEMVVVGSKFYFPANDGTLGRELWESDGSAAGTRRVTDVNPSSGSSNPLNLTNLNGVLFFIADDGSSGPELFKFQNGIATLIRNINTSPGVGGSISDLVNVGGKLFFAASDGSSFGRELWMHDPVSSTTQRVRDINPGAGSSDPRFLTNINGALVFTANDGTNGNELWTSVPPFTTASLVSNIHPTSSSTPSEFFPLTGGSFVFLACNNGQDYELWKSDGIPGGVTQRVKDINVGAEGSFPGDFIELDGLIYFAAYDGSLFSTRRKLYRTDGTSTGTLPVAFTVPSGEGAPIVSEISKLGSHIYILTYRSLSPGTPEIYELWRKDGSTAEPSIADNLWAAGARNAQRLTPIGTNLFFTGASDFSIALGKVLWKY